LLRRRAGRTFRSFLFGLWSVGISVPLATLAVQHDLPFARRAVKLASGRTGVTESAPRPTIRHVLAADCPCSQAVADRLAARGADAAEREEVWIVGSAPPLERRLAEVGYRMRQASAQETLDALGVVGAPFLLVYAPTGEELYGGGYGPKRPRAAADVEVTAIIRAVRAGGARAPYPAYGCLVGDGLRRQVDPLRLKYARATRSSSS
jgi:hypothetical protein